MKKAKRASPKWIVDAKRADRLRREHSDQMPEKECLTMAVAIMHYERTMRRRAQKGYKKAFPEHILPHWQPGPGEVEFTQKLEDAVRIGVPFTERI